MKIYQFTCCIRLIHFFLTHPYNAIDRKYWAILTVRSPYERETGSPTRVINKQY